VDRRHLAVRRGHHPDAGAIYAGDSVTGALRKVTLSSGTVTTLNYTPASGETHSFDVAIGANGRG
jgi:hypothetical protein